MRALVAAALASSALAAQYVTTVVANNVEASAEQNMRINSINGVTSFLVLDDTAMTLGMTVFVSQGFAITAAHIHGPALVGQNGGVAIGLNVASLNATVSVTAQQLQWMLGGRTYLNFHSTRYPGGEARGQILFAGSGIAVATRTQTTVGAPGGSNSAGANDGYAIAQVNVINEAAGIVNVTLKTFNLPEPITLSHIHVGTSPGDTSGAIACTIASPVVENVTDVSCTLTNAGSTPITSLRNLNGYVNLHTASAPTGYLRGAIVFPALLDFLQPFQAVMTAAAQTSPVFSNGVGVFLAARPYNADVSGYIANTFVTFMAADGMNGTQTLAHLHGPALTASSNAGVVVNLPVAPHSYNLFTASASVVGNITAGFTYVNVHSTLYGSGEIRGTLVQVVPPPSASPTPSRSASPGRGGGSGASATTLGAAVGIAAAAIAVLAGLRRE